MKVFIAGPRALSILNNEILYRLNNIMLNNFTVLVGDANGIDTSVQKFYAENNYSNVLVYAANGKARNNIGNWNVVNIQVSPNTKGFDYYSAKDLEMAKESDCGFMIWNGTSKGTLNNIINIINFGKKALVYFVPNKIFYMIKTREDINSLIERCEQSTKKLYNNLMQKENLQLSFLTKII